MKTLGIDIGGSKIRAILWDDRRVLAAQQVKTPKNLDGFKKEISKLATRQPSATSIQVGIGAAGIILGTKIVRSPNIKYLRNFDFAKLLGGLTAKLKLGNDAQCFARSALRQAQGKQRGIILAITLGTGIGRGLAKNGEVLKLKKFEYPELWEKEYQKMRGKPKAVMSGEFADFLAKNLSPIVKKYKVNSIIFGGGVTDRNGFAVKMQNAFRSNGIAVNIGVSKLGKNAVAVGAALMLKTP